MSRSRPRRAGASTTSTSTTTTGTNSTTTTPPPPPPPLLLLLPAHADRMAYRIQRGEQGVLTFEPYKSHLLPLWRFRTAPIARASAAALWREFEVFGGVGDFVGMDMARKFLQMGMTRAKRYANYKGGRKYDAESGRQLDKSLGHEGKVEKLEASNIFRGYWERCQEHKVYGALKEEFLAQQKEWDKQHPRQKVDKVKKEIKPECIPERVVKEEAQIKEEE